jgi:hypothetical protein
MWVNSLRAAWQQAKLRYRLGRAVEPGTDGRPAAGAPSVEAVATWALVAAGLVLRARGILFGSRLEFWNDEASWAMHIFERPLSENVIRPPAFVILSKLSAMAFGYRELGFRLLPWLAGMLTPIVAVYLAARFLRNAAARVLFVAVISLSYNAIDFSKEFKQYAVALLLHLLLPLLVFNWLRSRTVRGLVIACAAAVAALLFSQDVMFLYPGLFLTLLIETWRRRDRRQLVIVLAGGVAAMTLVLGSYFLLWSRIKKDNAEQHWGNRYNVFYLKTQTSRRGAQGDSHLAWFAGKYQSMAAVPGVRRDHWESSLVSKETLEETGDADRWLWTALHVVGLALLVRQRRFPELLLFWSPVLVMSVANFAGRWPTGPFRTNLFLVAGMTAIACCAFEWRKPALAGFRSLVPAAFLVLLPVVLFERDFHEHKPGVYSAGVLNLMKELANRRARDGERQPLYMDTHACQPFLYYTRYHPRGKALWQDLEPKTKVVCGRASRNLAQAALKLKRGQRAWFILANQTRLPPKLRVLEKKKRNIHTLIQVQRR